MQPHQERVVAEKKELDEKIDKLENRVTEALALESAKLNELAATLNG